MSSVYLLKESRFGPLFWVQFLGAFNDNVYKQCLVLLISFKAYQFGITDKESESIVTLSAGIFILPFFLFSALAGQLAEKFEKSMLIRYIKASEIVIMFLGAVAFYAQSITFLLAVLFLMGAQSTFFGPIKFSILPQVLKKDELIAGNGLVEMGTFTAIILGMVLGGLLVKTNYLFISLTVILLALLGWIFSRAIPPVTRSAPSLRINWNLFSESYSLLNIVKTKKTVFLSVLGISWFWFFGSTIFAQIANYTKFFLHGNGDVATFLTAMFAISVAIGSILCEKLSGKEIEIGLVPVGALGMTVFCGDLFFINYPHASQSFDSLHAFLLESNTFFMSRIIVDIFGMGIFSSFYIVPLNTLIQDRSDESHRSRVIAGNNILNAFFMVCSAVFTLILINLGANTLHVFLAIAILNFVVATYIFLLIPEFTMRFVVWLLASTIYRLHYAGRENIPKDGPAIIVCNHVSFIDWFIIAAACQRPVRFVMYYKIFQTPGINIFFRLAKAIPIAPAKENAKLKEQALNMISESLQAGELVCLFPEGQITHDGKIFPFRKGLEEMVERDRVPVIPACLDGLWGSFFSRKSGHAMASLPKPKRRHIWFRAGAPILNLESASQAQSKVEELLDMHPQKTNKT